MSYALLAAAWCAYLGLHSLLASLSMKRWVQARWPAAMPWYRVGFNAFAVLGILPLLGYMYALGGEWLWRWEGVWFWLGNGLALLAMGGFAWTLRYYDGAEFLGLRQYREGVTAAEDQEHFHISPLHRYVRHPWYSLGLVILWTRDMNGALLLSAVLITLYLALGSWLEERKLIAYHGERYRQYRARVPALVPLPWKRLSKADAERLSGD